MSARTNSHAFEMISNYVKLKYNHLTKFKYIIDNTLSKHDTDETQFNECISTLSDY